MQLKITRDTRKKIVTLTLETTSFSVEENKMLDQMGEPRIDFEKQYGKTPISIQDKKIRSGFKYKVKFDCNEDGTEKVSEYIEAFLEDIEEVLTESMSKLKEEYTKDLEPASYYKDIKY